MELGIGSYAYRWAVGTDAFSPSEPMRLNTMVEETATLGCMLLQIADSKELEAMDAGQRRWLRDHAARAGVRLQTGTSGCTPDQMVRHLEIARDLDADVVRVVLDADGVNPTQREVEATLGAVAPSYAAAGVTVAIENHFLTPSTEIDAIVRTVASPAVGVCLDTANSIMVHEWPDYTIGMLAPHAVNLHLKDYAVVPDENGVGGHVVGRRLGDGLLGISALLDALAAADARMGGRLGVIIEQWLPFGPDELATLGAERAGREANVLLARAILDAHTQTAS